MAGLTPDSPWPTEITLHKSTQQLEVAFNDGQRYQFPTEFLRVYSPSAEVRGHGPGQEVLQTGKRNVAIQEMVPVGTYAILIRFSDGHDTGIFSWDYLRDLGVHQKEYWDSYISRMEAAGASRDPA
jgi:DUF971 family protein